MTSYMRKKVAFVLIFNVGHVNQSRYIPKVLHEIGGCEKLFSFIHPSNQKTLSEVNIET